LKVNEIELLAAKPLPEAVTTLPTMPLVGLRLKPATIVKLALLVLVPSVAVTLYAPVGNEGTVIVQPVPLDPGKLPFGSVMQLEATPVPLNVNEIVAFGAKAPPEARTTLAVGPEEGVSERWGVAGTVKVALAEIPGVNGITLSEFEPPLVTRTSFEFGSYATQPGPVPT
jgi:hypothetical protein